MRPPVRRLAFLLPPFLLPLTIFIPLGSSRIASPASRSFPRPIPGLAAALCRDETIGFRRGW